MKRSLGFRRNRPSHDARDQPRHGHVLGHLQVERNGDHGELASGFDGCRAPWRYRLHAVCKLQHPLRTFLHAAGILPSVLSLRGWM